MPFEGKAEVTYTKNNNVHIINEDDDAIIDQVIAHARNHLSVQHPELDIAGLSYQLSEPDYIMEIMSDNNPQEQIQIPPLEIQLNGDTYVITFGLLEFNEQNNNQNGGRRRHKSRSRRAKKTAKRRLKHKYNLKRKTYRSKRKLHCK